MINPATGDVNASPIFQAPRLPEITPMAATISERDRLVVSVVLRNTENQAALFERARRDMPQGEPMWRATTLFVLSMRGFASMHKGDLDTLLLADKSEALLRAWSDRRVTT